MSEHVIELNGKRYDAITGAHLGKSHMVPVPAKKRPHTGKTIDGFMRPGVKPRPKKPIEPAPVATAEPKPAVKATGKGAEPVKNEVPAVPNTATHAWARHHHATRRPEHSKTLMRSSVKRPQATLKPAIKPQAPAEIMAKPASSLARKHSAAAVDHARMERAVHIPKHNAITRFHHQGAPIVALAAPTVSAPIPVIEVKAAPPHHSTAPQIKPLHPDIFEAALRHANSHKELPHKVRKKRHHRLANTMAGVAAFLVIAGFIGYLNMPALELRVASVQAGFHATLPDYHPTGYALTGGIKRSGGTVSMSFRSGASMYTVTQQASAWNSQTLLDSTLALAGDHQAVQEKGQTIYIYGDGTNAAWVNRGIRYDLAANAELSKDDIVSIATSL